MNQKPPLENLRKSASSADDGFYRQIRHDLVKLIQDGLVLEPGLRPLISTVAGLSDYAAITRYPPTMHLSSPEVLRAVQDAEQVYATCQRVIE